MNIEALKDEFEEQGYLHLQAYFDTALMQTFNDLIDRHFKDQPGYVHNDEFLDLAATEVIPWFPQRDGVTVFDAIEQDAGFQALSAALLGDEWQAQYCMVMYSHAGTLGQAWHQDCPPDDPRVHNLNRLIYTHAIDAEVGGEVVVMPGSHRQGLLPVGDPHEDMKGQVVLSPGQGDCMFLHGHLWHRVLPIRKGYRYSTNYRAAPSGTPDDITDICVYRNMRYRFSTAEVVERR